MSLRTGAGGLATFGFTAGGLLLLLWLFIRRIWLVFRVGGTDCFGVAIVRSGSGDITAEEFIQTLFKRKRRRPWARR